MARKPKSESQANGITNESNSFGDSFKQFIFSDGDIEEKVDNNIVIPTGIDLLDTILGGGIRMHLTMFIGHSGGGKTAMALQILKSGQTIWGDKFLSAYIDTENSIDSDRMKSLGINPKSVLLPSVNTVESLFKCIEKVCAFKQQNKELMDIPSLIVWDSIPNTHTDAMMVADERNNMLPAQRAAILTFYLPKYVDKISKYNIALLAINQYRDDVSTDMYNKKKTLKNLKKGYTVPGGNSLVYNSMHIIDISAGKSLEEEYGFPCSLSNVYAIKNKKFKDNIDISVLYGFDTGFSKSNFWTNYEMLKTFKYIKPGAWTYLTDMPEVKFRQKEVFNVYNTNVDFKNAFDSNVKDCIRINFMEKYKNCENNEYSDILDESVDDISDSNVKEDSDSFELE